MTKDVFLTLQSIKYTGKSIGNDIRIEIEAIGKPFQENYEINRGETQSVEEEIGVFPVDQSSFRLPVTVRIIEQDTAHNDVGQTVEKIVVDLNDYRVQKKQVKVTVTEMGWPRRKNQAVFHVGFDIQVMDTIRTIEETDSGWLLVKMPKNGKLVEVSLPAFLKVRFDRRENNRDYFTILEGILQGQSGSVILGKERKSFLLSGHIHTGPIHMRYSKSREILIVQGKEYKAVDDPDRPWKRGFYDIEIPDHPHKKARQYLKVAPQALVWFHIGHERDPKKNDQNYIHTGQASLGCITITEHERWNELYGLFIKARLGDSQSIGVLEVID